ncbi:MAG: UDP-N-acetylmuramoyl-L-alanyl-D-glutamate--2,6-diaminopimelate ligase [Gemmatimonadales bacterium]|nr:UDP-N-acetylmuramoyl-L-alanyl-D-glutamate--2,6-diaminopimelate ligase [Gemmatimonadales bacterium]
MTVAELIAVLRRADLLVAEPDGGGTLADLTTDSREVTPGCCFVAVRGSITDGHRFIDQAAARGAGLVVAEQPVDTGVPVAVVRDGARAAEALAVAWFGEPAASLRLVGVTGTNGKTTTTMLVRHLLGEDGAVGSIGTLGAFDGGGKAVPSTAGTLTTPGPVDLQRTLRQLVDRGVRQVVMEASSHALDQRRLDALNFAAGVFTNLTRDHLDYHREMADYLRAKLRLADLVSADGVLAINTDDPAWAPLDSDRRAVRWGTDASADLRIATVHPLATGSMVSFSGKFGSADVQLPLPGAFNVANAAGAAAVALGLGLPMAKVMTRLGSVPQVPGRMERIVDAPFHVLRDYAHTPDALERVLATLRAVTPGRLIVVFGCGGDRDRGKRPLMGQVVAAGADHAVVTSDNPRTENPERIIDDIVAGMTGARFEREADRWVAIATALGMAGPGDAVLLAGKGHESYQIVGTERLPFDERTIVLGLLGR